MEMERNVREVFIPISFLSASRHDLFSITTWDAYDEQDCFIIPFESTCIFNLFSSPSLFPDVKSTDHEMMMTISV